MINLVAFGTRLSRAGIVAALVALMGACGGGGGSGGVKPDPPPAAPPPDPAPPSDPEEPAPQPLIDAHLAITGVPDGRNGNTFIGRGVTIGVVDTGVRRDHPSLAGRVVDSFTYVDPDTSDLSVEDAVGHGTSVAQVAAGAGFGAWPGGVAPGAELVSARFVDDAQDGAAPAPRDGSRLVGDLAAISQDMIASGVDVMNNSWGGLTWDDPLLTQGLLGAYRPFIIDHGGLVVFATGNDGHDEPTQIAALPSQGGGASFLEQGWLAVAAVDSTQADTLAEYSNACGAAMHYCLVAPGDVVVTGSDDTSDNPTYWVDGGTSLAAPQVAGAAALVWEKFDYFGNDLVRQTLLGSATDLGQPGVDPVYGYGRLDVGKAMRGPSRLDWGDVWVRLPWKANDPWWNGISGVGGLTLDGGGNVIDRVDDPSIHLDGENTFTGGLNLVNGVSVSVSGSLASDVWVDHGSFFYPWEATLHGDVHVEGLLIVNNAVDAISPTLLKGDVYNDGALYSSIANNTTLEGNYYQGRWGTFEAVLGADPLRILGEAHLDGRLYVVEVADGYVAKQRTEVLVAEGGVFGEFKLLQSEMLLEATVGYGSDRVWLDVERVEVDNVDGMTYTANSFSAAQRIERAFVHFDKSLLGPSMGRPDALAAAGALQRTRSMPELERSLDSLAGDLHAADAAFAMMAIDEGRHSLESRLDRLERGTPPGRWATRNKRDRSAGLHTSLDTNGWLIGHDGWLSPHLMVGAAFGQTTGSARNELRHDRERNRQYEGQLYAGWTQGDVYLLGRMTIGRMERSTRRDVLLGNQRFGVDAQYANQFTSLGLQAGRRFDLAGATLTPYLGVQALRLERGDFAEHGAAGFGLSTAGSVLNGTQGLAGARLQRDWQTGLGKLGMQARFEFQRALGQSGQSINARFTGIDVWAPVPGTGLGEEAALLGLGVQASLPIGRFAFELDARREFGETWTGAYANWAVGF